MKRIVVSFGTNTNTAVANAVDKAIMPAETISVENKNYRNKLKASVVLGDDKRGKIKGCGLQDCCCDWLWIVQYKKKEDIWSNFLSQSAKF